MKVIFIEDVKDKLLSSPNKLLDGCDGLAPYVDRWTQLGKPINSRNMSLAISI